MTTTEMREHQINIRLTPEEQTRFDRVARHYGLNLPNLVRFLVRREEQDLLEGDRERWKKGAPKWERDKAFIAWLVPIVNLMKLNVQFDERTRTVTIESPLVPPVQKLEGLQPFEAIDALASWPKGDIIRIDPHSRVVSYVPRGSGRVEEKAPPPEAVDDTFDPPSIDDAPKPKKAKK